jgi:F0F1-type ATP synthase assembly protein I
LKKLEDKTLTKLAKAYQEMSLYLGLGIQMAATIVLMFFLGKWLDEYFEISPVLTITFSAIGGFAGIYNFIHSTINIANKAQDKTDDKK